VVEVRTLEAYLTRPDPGNFRRELAYRAAHPTLPPGVSIASGGVRAYGRDARRSVEADNRRSGEGWLRALRVPAMALLGQAGA
jgi:hypothetical protein